ncbi:HTH-10 family transcription regulator [Natrialba magadii ATCC 43099]|uniref:Bacterio-opsin activator HTH domain-containing protein n=1 Tax=Natrialba magadii (strain ATCC 43099 / DSM 3394 / CCM 3739 / CIP 104546 / IAM 13178 / JCM 8861 / NBRC 102185 / NCIMB 2190 / MS3) TaxID=547559 RepID=D3T0A0_NATMM|nr:helix-turn-helix domain-containing protein [Natrialba magadii]ADD04458.1 HTH-10 family transcription regulator [Natrialba magadii ATCC 43099]ELY25853.1 bacterio-opsin activator HTH domain-containing protein [Natrialba magadii ATCC 43099]
MSVIAEFTLPADAFALGDTFDRIGEATIEVERLATHSREWIMPFLWVSDCDIDAMAAALESDSSIEEFELLDQKEDIAYLNVHWTEPVQQLVDEIVNQHGIIQEAQATDGRWFLKLKFVSQTAVKGFQRYFQEKEYTFELQRIYDGTAPREREYELTTEQREALVVGLELGYFAIPRNAQISDLADELGISTNAVSQRLRRATANLTQNTLVVSSERAETASGESDG